MKKIFYIAPIFSALLADEPIHNALTCDVIFESRKSELVNEISKLTEKELSIKALQKANEEFFNSKKADLQKKQSELDSRLKSFNDLRAQKEAEDKKQLEQMKILIAQNQKLLDSILKGSQSKVAETFAKMKDSKAADILSDMDIADAADILFFLKPQITGKILSKMDPKKAASLTDLLKKGPPFGQEKPAMITQPSDSKPVI